MIARRPRLPHDNTTPARRLCVALLLALSSAAGHAQAPTGAIDCFASLRVTPVTFEACTSALATLPADSSETARVHGALAMLHARNEDLPAARAAMDTALAISPEDPVVQANSGSLLLRAGDFAGAIAAFDTALSGLADDTAAAAVHLNRSLALRALGRYDQAAHAYARYLELSGRAPLERPGPNAPISQPVEPARATL